MTGTLDGPDFGGQTFVLSLINDTGIRLLHDAVLADLERRAVMETAAAQAEALATQFLQLRDAPPIVGDDTPVTTFPAWKQPTGGHDAYPAMYRVTDGGKFWYSLIGGNVWRPGASGWREFFPVEDDGTETFPDYVPPTGAHDAYRRGEKVTFEGYVYESLRDGNVWSPTDNPAGWELLWPVGGTPDPDPDPDPDPEPPAPTVPEWVQPTGGHNAYNIGARVRFEGKVYESLINGNTWSPTVYPAGWKLIP